MASLQVPKELVVKLLFEAGVLKISWDRQQLHSRVLVPCGNEGETNVALCWAFTQNIWWCGLMP